MRFVSCCLAAVFVLATSISSTALEPDPAKIAQVKNGTLTEAKASWWGFDVNDSTQALQAAIDSGVKRLVVDRQKTPWIVSPIKLRSNLELVLEKGTEILAKKGEYKHNRDSLLNLIGVENVRITGPGATLRMRLADYMGNDYTWGEWRHAINIMSGRNIQIEGLLITQSGGDGIYLGVDPTGSRAPCTDIHINNVVCDANGRQGISVISAVNLLIENTILRNTKGMPPMAGIDFEPNSSTECFINCVLRNCVSENNNSSGYIFAMAQLNETSKPIDIIMENCISRNNRAGGIVVSMSNGCNHTGREVKPFTGSIVLQNCRVENEVYGLTFGRKAAAGPLVTVRNCQLVNCSQGGKAPVQFYSRCTDTDAVGGVVFDDLLIRDDSQCNRPIEFISGAINGNGLVNVKGTLALVGKEGQHKLQINDAWLEKNYPSVNIKKFPPFELPRFVASEPIQDDGSKVKRSVLTARSDATCLFAATKDQKVRFVIEQKKIGRYGSRLKSPVMTLPSGKTKKLAPLKPSGEDSVYEMTALETGNYMIRFLIDHNAMVVKSSNVPFAFYAFPYQMFFLARGDFYFRVPDGTKDFQIKVFGAGYGPGEGVKATLFDPDGKQVWVGDTTGELVFYSPESGTVPPSGLWKINFAKPSKGIFEDFGIALEGIPPLISHDPNLLPVVAP